MSLILAVHAKSHQCVYYPQLSTHCVLVMFDYSLLDVFSEPAKSLLCRDNNEITLNLVFEYVAQDLAQHIEASGTTVVFSEAYIKVTDGSYCF